MRTYIRSHVAGATFFFTLTLEDRSARTLVTHIDALRAAFTYVKVRHPFSVDAIVVLPEHLHAIWTLPVSDSDYANRWMLVKQLFTKRIPVASAHRGKRGERSIWQRRYWEHQVLDEEDFARHVEYIHFNPVKHGHVERARDWPYSSFHRFVRQGMVVPDWGVSAAQEGRYGE